MSSVCRTTLFTAFIFFTAKTVSIAQLNASRYEIGLNVGTLVYQGDLSTSFKGEYRSVKPALAVSVSRRRDPYFALRANLLIGKVSADESTSSGPEWKQFRNFAFNTPIFELSSTVVFAPFGESSYDNIHKLSPYVFAGAGLSFVNIKRDWSKLNREYFDSKSAVQVGLATDSLQSLPKVIPVLPVGAGLRFAISSQLSLHTEATYRFTASDYLDGFKYSANPQKKDSYYGLSIGLSYRLGGYRCAAVGR